MNVLLLVVSVLGNVYYQDPWMDYCATLNISNCVQYGIYINGSVTNNSYMVVVTKSPSVTGRMKAFPTETGKAIIQDVVSSLPVSYQFDKAASPIISRDCQGLVQMYLVSQNGLDTKVASAFTSMFRYECLEYTALTYSAVAVLVTVTLLICICCIILGICMLKKHKAEKAESFKKLHEEDVEVGQIVYEAKPERHEEREEERRVSTSVPRRSASHHKSVEQEEDKPEEVVQFHAPEPVREPSKDKGWPEPAREPSQDKGWPEPAREPSKDRWPEPAHEPSKDQGWPQPAREPSQDKGWPEPAREPSKDQGWPREPSKDQGWPREPSKDKGWPEPAREPSKDQGWPEPAREPEHTRQESNKAKDPFQFDGAVEEPVPTFAPHVPQRQREAFNLGKCLAYVGSSLNSMNIPDFEPEDVEEFVNALGQRWRDVDMDSSGLVTRDELRTQVWLAEPDCCDQPLPSGDLPKEMQDIVDKIMIGTGNKESFNFWDFANYTLRDFAGLDDVTLTPPPLSESTEWAYVVEDKAQPTSSGSGASGASFDPFAPRGGSDPFSASNQFDLS